MIYKEQEIARKKEQIFANFFAKTPKTPKKTPELRALFSLFANFLSEFFSLKISLFFRRGEI